MLLESDDNGFPMVQIEPGLSVSLLPVTKVQFERFIAQVNAYGDSWYDEVLRVAPRESWRELREYDPERLFMTGILPSEALDFASALGEGFDLPDVREWRQIFRLMFQSRLHQHSLDAFLNHTMHPAARSIIKAILEKEKPETWGGLALLRGGIFEWVRDGMKFGGLGVPLVNGSPVTFNPEQEEPRPLLRNERSRFFGFRLVYRPKSSVGGTP
jgi:hypothetical protein